MTPETGPQVGRQANIAVIKPDHPVTLANIVFQQCVRPQGHLRPQAHNEHNRLAFRVTTGFNAESQVANPDMESFGFIVLCPGLGLAHARALLNFGSQVNPRADYLHHRRPIYTLGSNNYESPGSAPWFSASPPP
jgi:hypothetical protein